MRPWVEKAAANLKEELNQFTTGMIHNGSEPNIRKS